MADDLRGQKPQTAVIERLPPFYKSLAGFNDFTWPCKAASRFSRDCSSVGREMRTEAVGFSSTTADGLEIFRTAILAAPFANPLDGILVFDLANPLEAIFLVPESFLDGNFAI